MLLNTFNKVVFITEDSMNPYIILIFIIVKPSENYSLFDNFDVLRNPSICNIK